MRAPVILDMASRPPARSAKARPRGGQSGPGRHVLIAAIDRESGRCGHYLVHRPDCRIRRLIELASESLEPADCLRRRCSCRIPSITLSALKSGDDSARFWGIGWSHNSARTPSGFSRGVAAQGGGGSIAPLRRNTWPSSTTLASSQ